MLSCTVTNGHRQCYIVSVVFFLSRSDGGHDSAEDAISCMELMLHKAKSDFQKQFRTGI